MSCTVMLKRKTREELVRLAGEIGLEVDPNWSDDDLVAAIEEKLHALDGTGARPTRRAVPERVS